MFLSRKKKPQIKDYIPYIEKAKKVMDSSTTYEQTKAAVKYINLLKSYIFGELIKDSIYTYDETSVEKILYYKIEGLVIEAQIKQKTKLIYKLY